MSRLPKLTTQDLFPGMAGSDSSEDELDESTVEDELEEKGEKIIVKYSIQRVVETHILIVIAPLTVVFSQKTFLSASSAL